MRKFIAALFLFAGVLLLARVAFAQSSSANPNNLPAVHDSDDSGPGLFYYVEYEQQPWRLSESPRKLAEQSVCLAIASGVLVVLIRMRAKRA